MPMGKSNSTRSTT
jgi:hypothetical protein